MVDSTTYPYTSKQQQSLKRPYPFVDYGGKEFFNAYKKTRESAIEELMEQSLSGLEADSAGVEEVLELQQHYVDLIDDRLKRKLEDISRIIGYEAKGHKIDAKKWYARVQEHEEIDIENAVDSFHLILSSDPGALEPEMEYLLHRILKKADLRVLRTSCNWDFKNTSQEEPRLETYATLTTTLILKAREDKDMQALSTALKLDDFLISQLDQLISPKGVFLTYVALKLELLEIEKLARSKGVEL